MLQVESVVTHYNRVPALKGVCLTVEKGEIVAVIGANGAGKTTLVNTISGLLQPTEGTIEFEGDAIHRLPAHKILQKGVVQIPEGRKVFPDMTVDENLKMGAFRQKNAGLINGTKKEILGRFPILDERKTQLAGSLSGGEQQMLAIGRALMSQPRLLMLDEPSLGLSPLFVARVAEMIQEIHRKGITILLIEQKAVMALALADRGYVMETGLIVLEGTGEELRANDMVRKAYLGK